MKKFLLSLACVLGLSTFASAETYTFTPTADNFVAETSIIEQGISFTVNKNKGSNNPTYVTDKDDATKGDARIYAKGSIEITTNVNIKSVSFAISAQGLTRFATITPSVGAIAEQGANPLVWNGEATSVTFTVGDKADYSTDTSNTSKAGQLDFTSITIVTDGAASYGSTEGGGTTDPGTGDTTSGTTLTYLASGADDWTLETSGELTVWTWNSYGYLKGNAYSGGAVAATAYAYSPVIDLTSAKTVSANFDHAAKFQTIVKDVCRFVVREENATEWTEFAPTTWPEAGAWTFANSGDIDLSAFAGKKVQVGFKYVSTDENADTWEVKNLVITTDGAATTDPGTTEPEVTVYNTIAELIAAAPEKATKVTVNGPLTVFYQSGKNTYVQDAAGTGLLVYDSTTELLKDNVNGDVIASVTGNYSPYNGLPEFVPTEVGTVTTGGAAVQPEEITVEELSIQDLNKYIKISGASISSLSGKNFTLKDETGEVAGYNGMSIELSEGENFTIVGVTNCYNTKLQVTPFSVDASQAVEACSAPTFSPNGGTVAYESEVTISTITEGASIFYSLDGSNPSIEYTAPIKLTSSCTVKAYASKEGLTNSEVSEATFTVLSADTKESTYDFTNPEGLTPAQERAEAGKFTSVAGVTFTSGSVSFAISEAATSNPPRLWTTSGNSEGAVDLRLYTGDSFTVSVPSGNKIKSIAFTKDGGNFAMEADNGTYDNGAWTGDSESIKFTMTATTRISTVTVLFEGNGSGVGSIVVDSENAPVEYYNLQGVRVANPTPGLYIVRQGTKVSKTVVR
jgi:hypothetical protein